MPGRRRRAAVHLALTACAVLAACEPPTQPIDPGAPYLLIHAVLDAGAGEQWVYVERVAGGFNQNGTRVSGAEVTVTTPDGQIVRATEVFFRDGRTSIGYNFGGFSANAIPLVPGGTYTLHVRAPNFAEVSGTTTMPAFPAFELPVIHPVFVRDRDTLRLKWPRVPGTASYQVDVSNTFEFEGEEFRTDNYVVFADTTINIAGTARTFENDPIFRLGYSVTVSVVAVDANYYTYYHPVVDPFAGAPPSRLTGAIGVFGSVAPLRLVTYLEVQ